MSVRNHWKVFVGYYFLILLAIESIAIFTQMVGLSGSEHPVLGVLFVLFLASPLFVSTVSAYCGGGVSESVAIGSCVILISSIDVLLYDLFGVSMNGSEAHPLYSIYFLSILVVGSSIGGFVIGMLVRMLKLRVRPSTKA